MARDLEGGHTLAAMKRVLAIGIVASTLPGCFPYVTSYVHLSAPGVSYLHAACGNVGPPVFASVERNGIRVEVTLEPGWASRSTAGFLRVRAPESAAVSIPDPFGRVAPVKGHELSFQLMPGVSRGRHVHRFEFVGLPAIEFSGTLTLPVIVVDGVKVQLPVFEFERRPYGGFAPLNC